MQAHQQSCTPITPPVHSHRHYWTVACVVLTLLKFWLVTAQPLCPITPSGADDELFLSQAETILRGEWLGKASDMVMVKGPLYPLWLSLNNVSGTPLLLSQAMLYALACFVLVRALQPVVCSQRGQSLLYLAILYNPGSWANESATRVMREGIYPALTLLLLACAMGTVLRVRSGAKLSALWAASAGFSGALFAMTREEGIWLLPSLAIIPLAGVVVSRGVRLRAWLVPLACAAIAYGLPTLAVATANAKQYGVFSTCETTAEYFKSAYGALTRVKSGSWNPYIPVSRETRKKIYAVSPAFREVEPALERISAYWTLFGCRSLGICDDIAGGWFMWALRGAVNDTGKYRQGASEARDWYRQLAEETDAACTSGRLDCLPRRSSLAPLWDHRYLPAFFSSFLRTGWFLTTFKDISPQPIIPEANESAILRFEAMTREHVPRYRIQMTGLLASRIGSVDTTVFAQDKAVDAVIGLEPVNLDAVPEGKEYMIWRYTVETASLAQGKLEFLSKDRFKLVVPIAPDSQVYGTEYLKWKPERFQVVKDASEDGKTLAGFRIGVLEALTKLYALLMPLLFAGSMILLFIRLWRDIRDRSLHPIPLFSLALLMAVVVRLLLLAVIDISSFPAINVLYCAPAYSLVIAISMLILLHEGVRWLPGFGGRSRETFP